MIQSYAPDQVNELKDNEITRKRLAKFMAQYWIRNIHMLEELHGAGQITQEEMKALMIDVVDHCYNFVTESAASREQSSLEDSKGRDEVPQWYDPEPMPLTGLGGPDITGQARDLENSIERGSIHTRYRKEMLKQKAGDDECFPKTLTVNLSNSRVECANERHSSRKHPSYHDR